MSVFLSVGAGFKICCLEFLERLRPFIHLVVAENNYSTSQVWLSCVSLNWAIYFLAVFVSVVSCRSCLTSPILDPFFLLTEFQFTFCTRLSPRKFSPQAWFYRISLPTEFHILCFSFRVMVSLAEWIYFIFSGGSPGINFRCYCTLLFWVCVILGGRWNSLSTVSGCGWVI